MKRRTVITVVLGTCVGALAASAQAQYADMAAKKQFSATEVADLGSWLQQRAAAMQRARKSQVREQIRNEILKLYESGTPEFRAVLGQETARAFAPLIRASEFELAHEVALMLLKMPVIGTRDALIQALGSTHSAIRYQGARGLQQLLSSTKDPAPIKPILEALGRAGGSEPERLILRVIYEGMESAAASRDFTEQDALADAILTIFDARLQALANGSHDEDADRPGIAASARIYSAVKKDATRKRLVGSVARFLAHLTDRYVQLGPAGGGVGMLDMATRCEEALTQMLQATDGAPAAPRDRVSERIKAKAAPKDVMAALAGWTGAEGKPGVLNGAPWNLPIGLQE